MNDIKFVNEKLESQKLDGIVNAIANSMGLSGKPRADLLSQIKLSIQSGSPGDQLMQEQYFGIGYEMGYDTGQRELRKKFLDICERYDRIIEALQSSRLKPDKVELGELPDAIYP